MALIKCSECGKEISDSCNQCIHCGYVIKKCPECKKVLSKEDTVCPYCGKNLKDEVEVIVQPEKVEEKPVVAVQKPTNAPSQKDCFALWEEKNPDKKRLRKTLYTLNRLFDVFEALILIVFLALCCAELKNNGLFAAQQAKTFATLGSVSFVVMWFFSNAFKDVRDYYTQKQFSLWCEENNIDPTKDFIYSDANMGSVKTEVFHALSFATYYKHNKDKKVFNVEKIEMLIGFAISIVSLYCVASIMMDNFVILASMMVKEIPFSFKAFYFDMPKVIIFGITIALDIILAVVLDTSSTIAKWKRDFLKNAKNKEEN